jgi:hypothetical protein
MYSFLANLFCILGRLARQILDCCHWRIVGGYIRGRHIDRLQSYAGMKIQ